MVRGKHKSRIGGQTIDKGTVIVPKRSEIVT